MHDDAPALPPVETPETAGPPEPTGRDRLSKWTPVIVGILTIIASFGASYYSATIAANATLTNDREKRAQETDWKVRREQSDAYGSLQESVSDLRGRLQRLEANDGPGRAKLRSGTAELVRKAEVADARLQTSPHGRLRYWAHEVGWMSRYAAECLDSKTHTAQVPGSGGKPETTTCTKIADSLTERLDKLRAVVPGAFNPK